MDKIELSPALQVLALVWKHTPYTSHLNVNQSMQGALSLVINSGITFELTDFEYIYSKFRAGYWLGRSENGHHYADHYYTMGCENNKSFCLAYEAHHKRQPFLVDGKRAFTHMQFFYQKLYCHITGWNETNDKIQFVGYNEQWGKGTRKLFSFDKKECLKERENFLIR